MTYAVGQIIDAVDFMNFRGPNAVNTAYANDLSAANKVTALIGVGFGTRGYGQASTISTVSSGNIISIGPWNELFSALQTMNTHTGSALTVPSLLTIGDIVEALNGAGGEPNVPAIISSLDTNRLNYSIAQMSLTSATTSTRTTAWTVSVYHEFTITFLDENSARYFFNSGGTIYVSASRTGGSATTLNSAISTMLNDMGTIRFGAQSTTYTGSGGTAYPIGYYGLTGSYQDVFFHPGPSSYSAPNYTLKARAENIAGVNGGNGTVLRFQALFETGVLPYSYNAANGTLTSSVSQLKATGSLTIASPAYLTTVNL